MKSYHCKKVMSITVMTVTICRSTKFNDRENEKKELLALLLLFLLCH